MTTTARAGALLSYRSMEPSTRYEQVEPVEAVPSDGWRKRAVGVLVLVAGLVLWLAPSQQTLPGKEGSQQTIRPSSVSAVSLPAAELSDPAGSDATSLERLASGPNLSTDVPLQTAVHEKAHIVIVRHGEKDTRKGQRGQGLSVVGQKRAQYLARCMSQATPTVAMPFGPPTYVMASRGKSSKSHRPIDTVVPLATALGVTLDSEIYFKDTEDFASHIQEVRRPSMTGGG
jgi:hypothetical protein